MRFLLKACQFILYKVIKDLEQSIIDLNDVTLQRFLEKRCHIDITVLCLEPGHVAFNVENHENTRVHNRLVTC